MWLLLDVNEWADENSSELEAFGGRDKESRTRAFHSRFRQYAPGSVGQALARAVRAAGQAGQRLCPMLCVISLKTSERDNVTSTRISEV